MLIVLKVMREEIKNMYNDRDCIAEVNVIPSIEILRWASNSHPKYTIAIPTYKRTDLLVYALDSCLSQKDYNDFEILVVDNNPERGDETERLMLSKYNKPNIAYYKNSENLGMTGNWNKLYVLARTEWVVMLHDDDMLYPDFMKRMNKVVENDKEAACIFSCYNSIDDETGLQPERQKCPTKIMTLKETDYLTGCHLHAPLGMTCKRDIVIELGGFNPDYYPSLDFHFHVKMAHFHTVRWLRGYPIATYRWLVNASQKEETLWGWLDKDSKIKRLILKNNKGLVSSRLFEMYLKYFNYIYECGWKRHCGKNLPMPKKPDIIYHVIYLVLKLRLGLPKKLRKVIYIE